MLPASLALLIFGLAQSAWGVTPQIKAGASHTVLLRADGTIWTVGSNSADQLGDGSGTSRRTTPVQVGNAANWVAIAAGDQHNLALKADGSLWAWGANLHGQLGDGTKLNQSTPVRVGTANDWKAVAAGGASSFALKANGTLWAWGANDLGQLGNGDPAAAPGDVTAPVQVLNHGTSIYTAIAAGGKHVLALQADGSLWAWGSNQYGQIAQDPADTASHSTPVQVGLDNDWRVIVAGGFHSVALKANGTMWAWGRSNNGQLGTGVTDGVPHITPVQVGTDTDWTAISAGHLHTLAVKRSGSLWAWGGNSSGQLGDGTITDRNIPIQLTTPSEINNIVAVTAGALHSLALKANGEIHAWGANDSGQLGDGTTVGSYYPFQVGSDVTSWVGVEPGGDFTVARRSNGTLWTWGGNTGGQLGDNTFTDRLVPAVVGTASNWISQASGWNHTVALQADGTLWTWGDNTSGQLGDGTGVNNPTPKPITATQPASAANNWTAVAAGDFHTLALRADGTLWAWGDNSSGQLGDGTVVNRSIPRQVVTKNPGSFDNNWIAIAAGGSHSLGLQADGTLWAWGDNSSGQLGDASFGTSVGIPNQVVNFTPPTPAFNSSWVAIAAGLGHSLALQANGTLWAWGSNLSGQLGNGNATDQPAPAQVLNPGATPYVAVTSGDSYSAARQADGSLWSWGNDTSGQLGNGATDPDPLHPVPHATPTRENTAASDWAAVGSGASHTMALKAGGTLWAWGNNARGQLGDGTTVSRNVPTPLVEGLIDADPAYIDFNLVAIGSAPSGTVTIGNKGNGPLVVSSLNLGGADSAQFSVSPGTCGAVPFTVAANGSCTVKVVFTAAAPAGVKLATLTIVSNDLGFPKVAVDLYGTAAVPYTITAGVSPDGSGTITPSGTVSVLPGSSRSYTVKALPGYHLVDVTVNGVSQGAVTSVTTPQITANTTVQAIFAIDTHVISATSDAKGTISPSGEVSCNNGSDKTFTFTPNPGYKVVNVIVDGVSLGPVPSYTFRVINAAHTIKLISIPDGDLNNDGKVDVADVLRALQIAVGAVVPSAAELARGDVAPFDNAAGIPVPDGQITVGDALFILRKVVGLTKW
jgi:alpha-tubulin suppressor-like RCC1 family protein